MSVRVLQGHVLDVLEREPAGSVHAVVCSPPYWQLRAYGTPPQVWPDGWVGELGQEPTPELYVEHLVAVFRAVRRVLRDDGTLWVNLAGNFWNDAGGQNGGTQRLRNGEGASTLYVTPRSGGGEKTAALHAVSAKAMEANRQQGRTRKGGHPVYKALDYVDVPGLVARALQADGWLWRSDVALVKSAPMPESVSGTAWTRCLVRLGAGERSQQPAKVAGGGVRPQSGVLNGDAAATEWADCPGCPRCAATGGLVLRRGSGRPTRAWERLLVFAKRAGYFWDAESVREPHARLWDEHNESASNWKATGQAAGLVLGRETDPHGGLHRTLPNPAGRNARDWLPWRPQPLKAVGEESEHYAAFPHFIPELAVKAGTSARGCCPGCGAPWARVLQTDRGPEPLERGGKQYGATAQGVSPSSALRKVGGKDWYAYAGESTTLDWRPTCACPPHNPIPATILDCFGGSGTSGIVADRLGRDAVLVELKPAYAKLAERRLHRDAPLLMWGQVTLEADTTRSVPEGVPLPLEALEETEGAAAGG